MKTNDSQHKEGASKMTREVSLLVNDTPIVIDSFVQDFIYHTVSGMLAALKGTGEIEFLDIAIDGDEVAINLNNEPVPTNPFVSTFIRNTVVGMVSSLKGVSNTQKIDISIGR